LNSIKYGTQIIEFTIQRKATLKNSYIHIDKNGVLVKTDTKTTLEEIKKMVEQKSFWIVKKQSLFNKERVTNKIETGSRLYYMGKSYYVRIVKDETVSKITINFTHSKFFITTPKKYTDVALKNAIEDFYKKKVIEKIMPIIKRWAKNMGVEPTHIGFRYSKKRWGSCSSTNRISFNYHLIKLSSSLIEYVVIHELAHIIQHNHSKEFWKLVYKYLPDYKVRADKIRVFEKLI